jgi:branched-chain amino acid transport system permease protein
MMLHLTVSTILMSAVYGFTAMGIILLFRTANILSFAQGEVLMFSAFFGTTVYVHFRFPYAISFFLVICMGVFVAVMMELLVFRQIRKRVKNYLLASLVASLGIQIFLRQLGYFIWGYQSRALPSPFKGLLNIFGVRITYESLFLIILLIVCLVLIQLFLNRTDIGAMMRGAAQNRELANLSGIDPDKTTLITFCLTGILGGISGMMLGPLFLVTNEMGAMIDLKAFMSAVIGGFGNPVGAFLGALVVSFIDVFGAAYISSTYKDIITASVLIIVLLLRPAGIIREK